MEKEFVKVDGVVYDFTPYAVDDCVTEMGLKYYGFIGPMGEFYKVRDSFAPAYESPHNTWAVNFIQHKGWVSNLPNTTASVKLVKEFGFILCTESPEDSYDDAPRYIIPEKDSVLKAEACLQFLTNEAQRETIQGIIDRTNKKSYHQR